LRSLDPKTAARLERLVRDALELVNPVVSSPPHQNRERWLKRLDEVRASVGTGKAGPSTEEILDDLRS